MQPFHLAIQVRDIDEARDFYTGLMGCGIGRSDTHWMDFDLYGHQLVCHLNPAIGAEGQVPVHRNPVDAKAVPVPHFGVVLGMQDWQQLADRLVAAKVDFDIPPTVRFRGEPGEQATLFLRDPSGNCLEFKGFRDASALFAT